MRRFIAFFAFLASTGAAVAQTSENRPSFWNIFTADRLANAVLCPGTGRYPL